MPIPISMPFRIEKGEKEMKLVGYGLPQRNEFFKQIFDWCKEGKIYQLKPVEVTASEVQRNYLFLCLSLAGEHIGMTSDGLRATIEDMVLNAANDPNDEFFNSDEWLVDVIDLETGEHKGKKLATMSQWSTGMMSDFIDFFQGVFLRLHNDFIFPNPEDYKLPKVGRRNEVPYPNEVSTIKIQ